MCMLPAFHFPRNLTKLAKISLDVFFSFLVGRACVSQVVLAILGSNDLPSPDSQVAGTIGTYHRAWFRICFGGLLLVHIKTEITEKSQVSSSLPSYSVHH